MLLSARLRPMIRIETLLLVIVSWLVATANSSWWAAVGRDRDWWQPSNWLFLVCCFAALVLLHFALLAPFAWRRVVRPLLTAIVVLSAAAAWYMRDFAVILDPSMVQNVLRTDSHEARELLSPGMLAWVLLWSVLPVSFIWWVRLEPVSLRRALLIRAGSMLAACVLAALCLLTISRDLTSFMRNQHEARYLITPGNYLYGLALQSAHRVEDVHVARAPVGTDAHFVRVAYAEPPRVLVLVVGETARAANFSLLGYPRETNPELAKAGVTAFDHVTSCGTSTEVSVPCMFSPYGRENYDERRIRNSESLLDVLARAGYAVRWLDNQSGCKGVCKGAGVQYEKMGAKLAPDLCQGDECQDAILVRRLGEELAQVSVNTVFVLHMMGNHGPAYFRRYPREYRRFLPDCETAQLRECSRQQVVNAYDNAVLYTDHVLAGVIRELAGRSRRLESAMIYVSDHGESLGEHGLYLHGIPFAIAPREQTHVPMLIWLSRPLTATDVDLRCLRSRAHEPLSHDNLFHSVLGLMDVQTSAYRPSLDIFDGCRATARTLAQASASRGVAR
ncbi:MAG TPA: phosphoethanolamine--lipid A transferase [Steroidobacteraceae bacterium]|nr:phosphoethanolamine--lipid A transferase [Steroidobacteraceae bacterium]